jgi:hypothetical protein
MCHLPSLFPIISTKLNHLPVQIMWTYLPWDFILDKKVYKRLELENRFAYEQGCKIFCKDDPSHLGSADQRTTEVGTGDQLLPMVKFQKHCNAIRQLLIDLALPRMREFFRMRAEQMKLQMGGEFLNCNHVEDYNRAYATGPYDNRTRAMVNFLSNELWGDDYFQFLEKQVMDLAKIKYVNVLCGGETPVTPPTKRKTGSIAKIYKRMKQTYFNDLLRHTGKSTHCEVLYARKLRKPMKGVRDVVPVTKETHGFNGYIGYCDGHSRYATEQIVVPNAIVPDTTASSLLKCLNELVQMGSQFSASEILDHWKKEQVQCGNGVPNEVLVTDQSSTSSSTTSGPTTFTLSSAESAASIASVSFCHI